MPAAYEGTSTELDCQFLEEQPTDSLSGEVTTNSPEISGIESVVDRAKIESQANYLITHKSFIELGYKSEQTYHDDARTLIFEALTASGHLSKVEITGRLEEIHAKMLSVLVNAYSGSLPEHEKRRRFQEICEELTLQDIESKVAAGVLPESTEVATISDYVSDGSLSDQTALSLGYRPYNRKGMVRSSRLRRDSDSTYTRITEQISRSNTNASRTKYFLAENNVTVRYEGHADVEVLGTQFFTRYPDGVVGLERALDTHQGVNIRHGEAIGEDQTDYNELREVSAEREGIAQCYVTQLAHYTKQLDQRLSTGSITQRQHAEMFKRQIDNILHAICVMDPSYAVGCFGEQAEKGFVRASNLTVSGDYSGAAIVLEQNKQFEQTVSFCGSSLSVSDAKKLGIEADSLEELVELGNEKWGWKTGVCRIEQCSSRPGKTKVGPCSICKKCQKEFDKGNDPTKLQSRAGKVGKKTIKLTTSAWNNFKPHVKKLAKKHNNNSQLQEEHEKIAV